MAELYGESQAGRMAFWLGYFAEPADFWGYIQTWYCAFTEAEYDRRYNFREEDFKRELAGLFQAENAGRSVERYFWERYDESFNRFAYDFGVSFDEDFQVADCRLESATDVEALLGEWASELAGPLRAIFPEGRLPMACNCFFGIPACVYVGERVEAKWRSGFLRFVGNLQENVYSDDLAARYNG